MEKCIDGEERSLKSRMHAKHPVHCTNPTLVCKCKRRYALI